MKRLFLAICLCIFPLFSLADNTINVTRGTVDPIPIAINRFRGVDPADLKIAQDVIAVITNDLKGSGIFRPISSAAFIESKTGITHTPLFAAWQQINANLLLNGEVTKTDSGKLQVKFILWDAILEKQLVSETFELSEKLWRRVAHKIADSVYSKVTGYDGYFNTRIVYISESGPYLKRVKRLALMDQDGANHQYLTNGSDLVLTPRFSPDGKKILYLSYKNRIPQVHILDLRSGKSQLLGHFPGMSFAPRFSPDGDYAIMSIAKNGATNIYEMNLKSKKVSQITEGVTINTSPSYSPDGKHIVFQSDRHGARQLFVMGRNGSNIQKISFGGGSYAEPNWSSRNFIAFTKVSRSSGFTIGVMKPDFVDGQSNERLIASGYLVEASSWAPNGRVLVFTKGSRYKGKGGNGFNRIYTIDFTGYNEHIIPTPSDASDPDWSHVID
jgi:TolB protein